MIDSMGAAARRLARFRLAAAVVCAGSVLLSVPSTGLASAGWSSTTSEATPGAAGASSFAIGLASSQDLTAVWSDTDGVKASVRSAASASWQPTPFAFDSASATGGADADVAVATDGTAVAVWHVGDNVWASVRATGTGVWGDPAAVATASGANSPQATIVGGVPVVYWAAGSVVQRSQLSAGLWSDANTVATSSGGDISDLRVALDVNGSGIASWLRADTPSPDVDAVLVNAGSWGVPETLESGVGVSSVAVATQSGTSVVAWNGASGVEAAISTDGVTLTPDAAVPNLASRPVVAVDLSGRVFLGGISGNDLQVAIRGSGGSWGALTDLGGANDADASATTDSAGDVVFSWLTGTALAMRAYDASAPTLMITDPPNPSQPGVGHIWQASSSDVWSAVGSTYAWTFTNSGDASGGGSSSSVSHTSNVPGLEVATATVTDGAGNATTKSSSIQIAAVGPTINTLPSIQGGSAPLDGGTALTLTQGTWNGNPTPTIVDVWQHCATGPACTTVQTGGTSYTPKATDVGFRIRVEETATNTAGAPTVDSVETSVVAPIATGAPALSAVPGLNNLTDGTQLVASAPASVFDGASNLTLTYHFQRCSGSSCTDVQAKGINTYTLTAADVGSTFQLSVSAVAGPVDLQSSQPATAIAPARTGVVAPDATVAPTLTGTAKDTQVLMASSPDSSWDGATLLDREYQFVRCNTVGTACTTIVYDGPSNQYTLTASDMGSTIRVSVLASKNSSAQVGSDPSTPTAVVTPLALSTTGTPSGQAKDGATLTAPATITWADQGQLSFGYVWLDCSPGCSPIAGASASTYVLQPTDVGSTVEVIVTASAGGASASVTSGQTVAVAPQNTTAPSVTTPAVARDGQLFSAVDAGWHGATGLSFTYVWKRCDQTGASCAVISSATGSTYTAGASDVGQTLRVVQSASKGASASTASGDSAQSAVIAPLATGLPTIGGSPQDTQMLTAASPASMWDGVSVTTTYQYYRCDASGNNCAQIPGANTSSYQLDLDDIGSTVRVIASASKNGSPATASGSSLGTAVIAPFLLTAATAPTGTTADGSTLTAAKGTWADQNGLSFLYQWFQCNPTCTSLGAASASPSYTLKASDVGGTNRVIVTAFVGAGQATSTSASSGVVAPVNTSASALTTPTPQHDGQVFTVSDGGWDGVSNLTFGYQWIRCASDGTACAPISGATSKTYTAGPNDVGQTLSATVAASKNGSGKATEGNAAVSGVVAPRNTSTPALSGQAMDGQTLTTTASTQGAWDSPAATLSFAYQWMRCDKTGANCAPIAGATGLSYLLTPDDVAAAGDATHAQHTLSLQVTATVNGASWAANSVPTAPVAAKPTAVTTLPAVSGDPIANTDLTAAQGTWTGTDISDLSYQWVRCNLTFSTCTNLGAASLTATRYNVQAADIGFYVTVIETVQNRLGATTTARAPASRPVQSNDLGATDSPVVSGTYADGSVLSTSDGAWEPSDNLSFAYHWLRCAPVGGFGGDAPIDSNSCPQIKDATNPTYALTSADVGSYVVSEVTATYAPAGFPVPSHSDEPSDLELAAAVAARAPTIASRPAVSGVTQQGSPLSATIGTWDGTNTSDFPITYAYQWDRCDRTGAACASIPGATTPTYVTTADDIGSTIAVVVTATNAGGSSAATSAPSAVIAGLPAASTGGGEFGATLPDTATGVTGGGGPKTASTQTGDHSAPRLTLALVNSGKLVGNSTLSVTATCPKSEKTCKAKFTLLAAIGKTTGKAVAKPVSIAAATLSFVGGQKKTLKLKLSSAARTVLKRKHTLKATLSVSVVDAAGNITPKETKAVTLRWK
jgi:hypothetical protein